MRNFAPLDSAAPKKHFQSAQYIGKVLASLFLQCVVRTSHKDTSTTTTSIIPKFCTMYVYDNRVESISELLRLSCEKRRRTKILQTRRVSYTHAATSNVFFFYIPRDDRRRRGMSICYKTFLCILFTQSHLFWPPSRVW